MAGRKQYLETDGVAALWEKTKSWANERFRSEVFKGVVHSALSLPTEAQDGWYYIIGTAGEYAGLTCEAGDKIVWSAGAWHCIHEEAAVEIPAEQFIELN